MSEFSDNGDRLSQRSLSEEESEAFYARLLGADSDIGRNSGSENEDGIAQSEVLCARCADLIEARDTIDGLIGKAGHKPYMLSSIATSSCEICQIVYQAVMKISGDRSLKEWDSLCLIPGPFSAGHFLLKSRDTEGLESKGWAADSEGFWLGGLYLYCPDGKYIRVNER